jgi:hypothetical protein
VLKMQQQQQQAEDQVGVATTNHMYLWKRSCFVLWGCMRQRLGRGAAGIP